MDIVSLTSILRREAGVALRNVDRSYTYNGQPLAGVYPDALPTKPVTKCHDDVQSR